MSKTYKIIGNDISDGYHTFDELYEHRCLLFVNLCLANRRSCYWKPDYDGWFSLYWESPEGQISYHVPNKFLDLVEGKIVRNWNVEFDGHTSADVASRLIRLASVQDGLI
jgi:hypothetical protein